MFDKEQMKPWHQNTLINPNTYDLFTKENPFTPEMLNKYLLFLNAEYPDFLDWMLPLNYKINTELPEPKNEIHISDYFKVVNEEKLFSELLIGKSISPTLVTKNNSLRF